MIDQVSVICYSYDHTDIISIGLDIRTIDVQQCPSYCTLALDNHFVCYQTPEEVVIANSDYEHTMSIKLVVAIRSHLTKSRLSRHLEDYQLA